MLAVKALVSLCIRADSPEPSLLGNAISTEIAFAGPYEEDCFFVFFFKFL